MDTLRKQIKERKKAVKKEISRAMGPDTVSVTNSLVLPAHNMSRDEKLTSLQRHRYQPRFNERISKLPLYLAEDIKLLRKMASDEGWRLDSTSFAGHLDAPLYSGNSFYEYMDESHGYLADFLLIDIKEMPVHINDESPWKRTLAKWRMVTGK